MSVLGGFAGDSAFVFCGCPGCSTRREAAAKLLTPFSDDIERRLTDRLTKMATKLDLGEAGQRDVQLTVDGEVLVSAEKICNYREKRITDLSSRDSIIAQALKARTGGYIWATPVSKYLEAEKGFKRALRAVHLKNLLSFVFNFELKAHFPQCIPGDRKREEPIEAENLKALHHFLAGFTPSNAESFKQWLSVSRTFVGNWWLPIPAITVVASSEDAFQAEMSKWSNRRAKA